MSRVSRARQVSTLIVLLVGVGCGAPRAAEPGASPAPAAPPSAAATPAPEGQDFIDDLRLLTRALACTGDGAPPATLDARVLAAHCSAFTPRMQGYRERYLKLAGPFLASLRPAGLPTSVVYPAGGGDLLSALTTYPDAREITTLSLELSGDPRRLRQLDPRRLDTSLALIRGTMAPLLALNDSTSENLMKGQQGDVPGQLAFFTVALAVHGFEPVALRYFRIEDTGGLHYLSAAEIEAQDAPARRLHGSWTPPDFAAAFANAEIAFRERGQPAAPLRVHRHIAANLADGPLRKQPGLLRYLEARGQVAALTKAASYLLWRSDFSALRQYLLGHMVFMVSDSTGIPPGFAREAGFVQETYGRFSGSFLPADGKLNEQFRALWREQPQRALPMRYGYVDAARSNHLLITRRKPA